MLTINRRHSIPGLIRSRDNSRVAEGLSHAEAPIHRKHSVSLFKHIGSWLTRVPRAMDARRRLLSKRESHEAREAITGFSARTCQISS